MPDDRNLRDLLGQELSDAFPVDSPLGAYLDWACRASAAPAIYHLASILTVACHELARRGFDTRNSKLSLLFALVGDSSTGKSHAMTLAQQFVRKLWDDGLAPSKDPWIEPAGQTRQLFETLRGFYDDDRGTTVCILVSEEFSSYFRGRESGVEFLCRIADGRDMQQQAAKGTKTLKAPTISGLFASTESSLASAFTADSFFSGVFSRICWIHAEPRIDVDVLINEVDIYDERYTKAQETWQQWFAGLGLHEKLRVELPREVGTMIEKAAKERPWLASEAGNPVNAVRTRLLYKMPVFSAIYALLSGRITINATDVTQALKLGTILLEHAHRMRAITDSDIVRTIDRASRLIDKTDKGITRRDLYTSLRVDRKTVDIVIETLLDKETILEDRSGTGTVRYIAATSDRAEQIRKQRAAMSQVDGNVVDLRRHPGIRR